MPRGRFVVFEGIDGTGKSTSLGAAADLARKRWPDLVATREETDTPRGAAVREAIAAKADAATVAYLFLADRAEHVREIRAHLDAGRHVLCDRYVMSTYAYQGVTLAGRIPDPNAWLRSLHAPIALEPDHTLLFVADPGRCVARTAKRGATTPYEKVEFLTKVQDAYKAIAAKDPKVRLLDAERPITQVSGDAARIVLEWLGQA